MMEGEEKAQDQEALSGAAGGGTPIATELKPTIWS